MNPQSPSKKVKDICRVGRPSPYGSRLRRHQESQEHVSVEADVSGLRRAYSAGEALTVEGARHQVQCEPLLVHAQDDAQ